MEQFREAVNFCSLEDLGYTGSPFTWSNGRQGTMNIRERLDRCLANPGWKSRNHGYKIRHLPRYKSDHSPVILECCDDVRIEGRVGGRYGFRFEHMWIDHPNFQNILSESWQGTTMLNSFSGKVNKCGAELSQWERKEFGSVRKKKKELTEKLMALQRTEEDAQVRQQIREVEKEMDQILRAEETMWFQRSRALWLKDGDRNSSFFHQKASHRKGEIL